MFTANENPKQAIVVLPAAGQGRIADDSLRRWLSRSHLRGPSTPSEPFVRVLAALGESPPEGLAALRFWGQAGERPGVWIAAADLVHLEATMDRPCLQALGRSELPKSELNALFDYLQQSLPQDSPYAFARIDRFGYLRGDQAIATATVSAVTVDGLEPGDYMPSGGVARSYLTLTSELQMLLHEHEINVRREAQGLRTINAVWLWGGGRAPEQCVRLLPPLIGADPLFQGYWQSCSSIIAPWPGSFAGCIDFAVGGFVALPPAENGGELVACLRELRELMRAGRLKRLVLLFRDGLSARFGRFDAFRLWRRMSPLL